MSTRTAYQPGPVPGRPLQDPWTVRRLGVVTALVGVSLLVTASRRVLGVDFPGLDALERWFDLDLEVGVPAWFSTILLFLAAQSLWRLSEQSRAGDGSRWWRQERLLAVVFVVLSVDEMTQVHERFNGVLASLRSVGPLLAFPWVVLALPVLAVVGAVMLGWVRGLPRDTRRWVLLSGAVYVGGAVGTELVGAVVATARGQEGFAYAAVYTVEETLEMLGVVLFLWAVDDLRRRRARHAPVGVGRAEP